MQQQFENNTRSLPELSTETDVIGRFRETLNQYQVSPLANYMPYTPHTERLLAELAALTPKVRCTARRLSATARRPCSIWGQY